MRDDTGRPRLLDDCFLTDKARMRHDDALALIRERLVPVAGVERVPLNELRGRFAAAPVLARRPVPAHDNAAVDGYAFSHAEYVEHAGRLQVAERVAAGHAARAPLEPGTAARIFTGAVMPEGAETVAMQEDCTVAGGIVSIPEGLKSGANRRKAGEDLEEGSTIIESGAVLRAQDMAAIASTGLPGIDCFAPLKVAIVSTGDELLEPGEPFEHGLVYDSNRPLLAGLLSTLPVEVTDLAILEDSAGAVRDALEAAAAEHDVVITSGGASRGEEDHVVEQLGEIGRRHLWQIAVKPGRPMNFGQIGDCAMFGLPGNPVAVFVCFCLYVRPALMALGGARWREPRRFLLKADFEIGRKKPDRREFLRGRMVAEAGVVTGTDKFPRDGSGLITSLREADGLIEIPEEATSLSRGEPVRFIPFSEFGL